MYIKCTYLKKNVRCYNEQFALYYLLHKDEHITGRQILLKVTIETPEQGAKYVES